MGRLLDRYGARIMLLAVGVLFGLAALWMSAVDHPVKLYFGFAALRTLGQGSLGLITSTLIVLWFVRLRGQAMAIGAIGGAVGIATFLIMTHALISHIGWRNTWVVLVLVIWVVLVPIILLVCRNPESVGLLIYLLTHAFDILVILNPKTFLDSQPYAPEPSDCYYSPLQLCP